MRARRPLVGVAVAALLVAASLLATRPFLPIEDIGAASDWGDARLITWTLAWHARWPLLGAWPLDAPFFAPEPAALRYSEPMIGLGVPWAPVTWVAGETAAFDLLRIFIPAVNALGMGWLAWHVYRDRTAAAVSACTFAFAYSQMSVSYMGLVHLALLAPLCAAQVLLDRWWTTGDVRRLAGAVALAVWLALIAWYSAVIAPIVLALQVLWRLAFDEPRRHSLRKLMPLVVAALIAVAALWPIAGEFVGMTAPTDAELRLYSLQPVYYVVPPADSLLGALLRGRWPPPTWDYTTSYYVGAGTVAAAAVGLVRALRGGHTLPALWALSVAVLGALLSFGPADEGSWRPFDLLTAIPGLSSFRAPGRMAVLVPYGLAILTGAAFVGLGERTRRTALVVFLTAFVAEHHMTFVRRATSPALHYPAVTDALAAERRGAVLMLPMLGGTASWPGEADYMHIARRAGVPLVNGYGRRTSGTYQLIQQTLAHGDAETLAWVLRHFDVTHVMVLPAYETAGTPRDYEPLLCPGAFERVASAADGALYRVIGGACAAHARADRGPLRR